MTTPSVSIICTARNAARTIEATLDSVLAQDMPDWEMIVVDDGSTDDTVAVVSRNARADRRIRLVMTGGIGRGRALNRAIAEAKADLIANIDADDMSHPARLRRQVEGMARHPEFAALCTDRVLVSGYGAPRWTEIAPTPGAVSDVTARLMVRNPVDHSSVLIRRSALRAVAGYSDTRRRQIDYDLWVRLAASGYRIGLLDERLTAKRLHEAQSYENRRRIPYILSSVRVQFRAIRSLGGGMRQLTTIPLRIGWNLLPNWLREHVKGAHR